MFQQNWKIWEKINYRRYCKKNDSWYEEKNQEENLNYEDEEDNENKNIEIKSNENNHEVKKNERLDKIFVILIIPQKKNSFFI